ncbi:acyltransferase [Aquihabitans sp. G128]|uniref:acyltransferase family protein n=1 Tax=Aquihabitans sp. G128 TaxID=2849779 RepID=UPI001C230C76|nr:acyltransferase [Aquihabitans sp. G128]QXC60405.1 acyltransferase [Aquihabitans sp. G128]
MATSGTAAPARAVDQSGLWGLRGVAAIAVVLAHTVVVVGMTQVEWPAQFAVAAIAFVHVFLVQSAYLLGRGYLRRQRAAEPAERAGRFLWKRATRILPGYWLMLAVAIPVMHLALWTNKLDGLAALFLVNVYSVPALLAGPIHVWCLQVEAGFYLLLPLHDRLSRRLVGKGRFPEQPLMVLLLGYAILGVLFVAVLYTGQWKVGYTWPFAYLTTFALGMGLAVVDVCRPPGVPGNRRPRLSAAWCVGIAVLILALMIATRLPPEAVNITAPIPFWQSLLRRACNDLAAFFLVAAFVFPDGRRSLVHLVLSSAPAQWLGQRSFHVYLWHIPVLFQLDQRLRGDRAHLPYLELVALGIPISILVAAAAHLLVSFVTERLRGVGPRPAPAVAVS